MDLNEIFDTLNLFDDDDISSIINELEMQTTLIRKTPEEIKKNSNIIERAKDEKKFQLLNEILIFPLMELAERIGNKPNVLPFDMTNFNKLSIIDRAMKLRNYLISKGLTVEMVGKLIPRTEDEFDILLKARQAGFNLNFERNQSLYNDNRILRAQQYLEKKSLNSSDEKIGKLK